jgi:hypothetical protein
VTAKYLLPCPCGRQIVIEPRQAGQEIPCQCGALLPAPTMLDMAELEPAPAVSASVDAVGARMSWDWQHRMRLLGFVLVVVAVASGALAYLWRPTSRFHAIDPEQIRQNARNLSPLQTWDAWEGMKLGLDRRVDQNYLDDVNKFHLKLAVASVLALAGIVLLGAGIAGAGNARREAGGSSPSR